MKTLALVPIKMNSQVLNCFFAAKKLTFDLSCQINKKNMATSTDSKHFWDRYQCEGVLDQILIVRFRQMNGVVYGHFEKCYKRYGGGIIPVEIVSSEEETVDEKIPRPTPSEKELDSHVLMKRLEIVFSSGLVVHHNNQNYLGLRSIIANLESLCQR